MKSASSKKILLGIFVAVIALTAILGPLGAQTASAQGNLTPAQLNQLKNPDMGGGLLGSVLSVIGSGIQTAFAWIGNLVLMLASRIVWISGIVLNYSINYSVVRMSDFVNTFPLVDVGWKIFRDLSNILFIFLILWIAIKTILDMEGSPGKAIGQIILVALFINFSLFITKAIVDASNIVTIQFYNMITPAGGEAIDGGLSAAFMQGLKMQTIYDNSAESVASVSGSQLAASNNQGATSNGSKFNPMSIIMTTVMGSIFLLIAAFVFFAVAIMFIIRLVTLMILMILSPLAFVGHIIPSMKSLVGDWWHKLVGQAMFAPLYMIMAYIVVATINSKGFSDIVGKGSWANALSGTAGNSDTVQVIINFIVLITLLIACLKVAKDLGGESATFGINAAKSAAGFAGGAVAGMSGRFARGTVGRLAGNLAENKALQDRASKGDLAAMAKLSAYRKTAGSSFDIRQSKIAQTGGGMLAKATGVSVDFGKVGKAGEKGYTGMIEEKKKTEQEYAAGLGPTKEQEKLLSEKRKQVEDIAKNKLQKDREEIENKLKNTGLSADEIKTYKETLSKMDKDFDANLKKNAQEIFDTKVTHGEANPNSPILAALRAEKRKENYADYVQNRSAISSVVFEGLTPGENAKIADAIRTQKAGFKKGKTKDDLKDVLKELGYEADIKDSKGEKPAEPEAPTPTPPAPPAPTP